MKTRSALFLTPILIINTQSSSCPSIHTYHWLNLKRSYSNLFSLRTLTCENRLIQLSSDIDQITIEYTQTTTITSQTSSSFIQSTLLNKWTRPILINFSVVFVSISMLCIALTVFLIRFCKK
jgi:hypothetical protein